MKTHKIIFGDKKLEDAFNSLSDKDPTKKGLIKAIREIKNDFKTGRLITKDAHNKSKIKNHLHPILMFYQ